MNEWWAALDSFEKLFWFIAIPFSIILVIQLILTFAGMGGSDADVGAGETDISGLDLETGSGIQEIGHSHESHFGVDIDPSFHFFTIRNFIAFFTLFGWGGIAAWNEGMSKPVTVLIAIGAGLLAMLIISTLFYFMTRLQDSGGALRIGHALHKVGNVYLPLKARGGNIGKVQIAVQGSLREIQAITKGDLDLATGTVVKVTGIINDNILVVEKVES